MSSKKTIKINNQKLNNEELNKKELEEYTTTIIINSDLFINLDYSQQIKYFFYSVGNLLKDNYKLTATFSSKNSNECLIVVNNTKLIDFNIVDIFKNIKTLDVDYITKIIKNDNIDMSKTDLYKNYFNANDYVTSRKFDVRMFKHVLKGNHLDLIYNFSDNFYKNSNIYNIFRPNLIILNNFILFKLCELNERYHFYNDDSYFEKTRSKLNYMNFLLKLSEQYSSHNIQ